MRVFTGRGSDNTALCVDSELVGTVPPFVLNGCLNQRIVRGGQSLGCMGIWSED